jgi:hypothetical protein
VDICLAYRRSMTCAHAYQEIHDLVDRLLHLVKTDPELAATATGDEQPPQRRRLRTDWHDGEKYLHKVKAQAPEMPDGLGFLRWSG